MNKKIFLIYSLSILWLVSYSQTSPVKGGYIDYSKVKNNSRSTAPVNERLDIETIRIYTGEEESLCSMVGDFVIKKDSLCFADREATSLIYYDVNGKYLQRRLAEGRGPSEILGITKLDFKGDKCITLDGNWILTTFDNNWNKIQACRFSWGSHYSEDQLMKMAHPDSTAIYEVEYEGYPLLKIIGQEHVLLPITTEHPKLNGFFKECAEKYYKECYSIGIVNLKNGKLIKKLCNWSPTYTKYQFIPNFRHVQFDLIDNNTLLYSFEAEPLIFRMNLSNNETTSFGIAGRDMKTDYRTTSGLDDAEDYYKEDEKKYGFYNALKYIPETGLTFRSYTKGDKSTDGGLQVYRNNVLIHDFNVPKQFKFIGYIKPYYFGSAGYDNDTEEMILYRFREDKL